MGARSSKNTTQNNRSDGHLLEYFRNTFVRGGGGTNASTAQGLTATGGVISDYTDGPAVYRAHVFTSTGTFTVTAPGTYGDTVEYLVVAGGGGAGADQGGGGGAGGLRTNLSGHPLAGSAFPVSSSPGSYTVTIGAGGKGSSTPGVNSTQGEMSEFYLTPASYPSTQRIRAVGGGLGGGIQPPASGGPGGSGGGGGYATGTGGSGNSPDPNHPQRQGYDGEPAAAFGPGYGGGGSGIVVVRYQIASLTATAKATGGLISFYSGKTIHTFTSSGDFNVTAGPLSVEYVVVAGGGSGGVKGGGGGAGGYRYNNAFDFAVSPGPNTVTVGAGGAESFGAFPTSVIGKQGTASVFSTIVSQGGGGGGSDGPSTAGVNGGSGGGAAGGGYGTGTAGTGNRGDGTNQSSATPVPSQGNNGASNVASSPYAGGGGGGAGGAGNSPGPGGAGTQAPPTFRNPVSTPGPTGGGLGYPGPSGSYWFAGGGAGGSDTSPTSTGGGPGGPYAGAGNGGVASAGISALTNSGSGGGGKGGGGAGGSGAGGSGIVIIAYPS
jgi:hypothetical protein